MRFPLWPYIGKLLQPEFSGILRLLVDKKLPLVENDEGVPFSVDGP
jgi:hypothetical protein